MPLFMQKNFTPILRTFRTRLHKQSEDVKGEEKKNWNDDVLIHVLYNAQTSGMYKTEEKSTKKNKEKKKVLL